MSGTFFGEGSLYERLFAKMQVCEKGIKRSYIAVDFVSQINGVMDSDIENFYPRFLEIAKGPVIDLSNMAFMNPWAIGIVCLLLIERQSLPDKSVVLPNNVDLLSYLKRIRFDQFLSGLNYAKESSDLGKVSIPEHENLYVQEIVHCQYQDEFSARLGYFEKMFQNFGMNTDDARRALTIVGELGNNVFDHNLGNWPTNFTGAIIAAQSFPKLKRIEVIVGDAGVGFFGSLRNAFPNLSGDIEAIKKGLEGNTGRIGEKRGNGLRLVQEWTIKNFHGMVIVHSGAGLVQVDKKGTEEMEAPKILGTLTQFMIDYT